ATRPRATPPCRSSTGTPTAPGMATGSGATAPTSGPTQDPAPTPMPTCSWAPSRPRRRRRPRPRRRLQPRRRLRRRRQRPWRRWFPSHQPRLSQGLLDEAADLPRPEEPDVTARVPLHPGPVPVLPEAARLAGRRPAVADACEQEAAVATGLGLEHQRRHDTMHRRGLRAEGAVLEGPSPDVQRAVTSVQVDD